MSILPDRKRFRRLFVLAGALLLLLSAAAHAQPLTDRKTLTFRLVPVLVEETVGEAYTEADTAYSSVITFRKAYRVFPATDK